jgi:hypothetical protein
MIELPEILEKRFAEYKKDAPDLIEQNDEYYGKYKTRPIILISFDYYYDGMAREEYSKIQSIMFSANTDFRKILSSYKIKTLKEDKGETFIIYVADIEDNKDWLEINKDCGYLKYMNNNTDIKYNSTMPLAIDTNKVLKDYWEKYPFTKI